MKRAPLPYAMPDRLEPPLQQVRAYWEGLRRHENNIPFWDDVKVSSLPDLADKLLLIDVFVRPARFRFDTVGREVTARYGETVIGKFLDEVEAKDPLSYLISQSSATVESGAPTFFRYDRGKSKPAGSAAPYSRLLLPLWGDGRIGMLLGALLFG
jgi:hypothetical protein